MRVAQPQVLPDGVAPRHGGVLDLDIEWPAVRNNLRYRLDRNG
jgi:hypothetical protein